VIVLALLALAMLGALSAVAFADEPPKCPAAPDAVEGDDVDPVVVEIRNQRRDLAAECARADWRAERAHDDQVDAVKASDTASDSVRTAVREVGTEGHALHVTSDDDAAPVTGTVALSDEDRDGFQAMFDAGAERFWFVFGGIAALVGVAGFAWATRPDR
jgi:hypothetical protein